MGSRPTDRAREYYTRKSTLKTYVRNRYPVDQPGELPESLRRRLHHDVRAGRDTQRLATESTEPFIHQSPNVFLHPTHSSKSWDCQDDLHWAVLFAPIDRSKFLLIPMEAGHKDISAGQQFLDRLRFPLLGLWHRLRPRTFRSRTSLPFYLNQYGLIGTGVEVGVQRGFFSKHILRYWRGKHLNCVDPWREFPPEEYDEPKDNVSQYQHDVFYRETLNRLKPFGNRASVHRTTSEEAAAFIEGNSLDFVFIDAQHHYEAVLTDVKTWFPKLRPGGLMSGHDWGLDYGPPRFGVKKAVVEFARENHLDIQLTADRCTWYIQLPKVV